MRLLVEFSHPAQVHKFKHVLRSLMDRGHEVLILSRDKDVMLDLLEAEALPHVCISKAGHGLMSMALELLNREIKTLMYFARFRPHLVLSAHSVAIVHIAWLLRVRRIVHDDTEHAKLQQRLYIPFATHVVTSSAYKKNWGKKQFRINSLEPLAYLHPDHFRPDPNVLSFYGLSPGLKYAVARFIAWQAAHDSGFERQSHYMQNLLLQSLKDVGAEKIVVTSEGNKWRVSDRHIIQIRPEHIHHVLAFARLCITEGGSVAHEAAVLGVPTVLANPLNCGYLQELKRYGLLRQVSTLDEAIKVGLDLWNDEKASNRWKDARAKLLCEKVNMAKALEQFLVYQIETSGSD